MKQLPMNRLLSRGLIRRLALVGGVSAFLSTASAQDNAWTNGAGNLTWNTTSANWTSPTIWNNANVNSAIFNTTGAGTITLAAPITARGLKFNVNGYTLTSSTLTLASGGGGSLGIGEIQVASGVSTTINSIVAGSVGLNKTGTGTLVLFGTNTYTGGTTINGGTLSLGSAGALGTTGTISFGGGTLGYTAGNTTDYSSRFSTAANQAYSVNTNGQNVTWTSALTSSGGTLTKTGTGALTLTGTNTYTSGTSINGGVLSLGSASALGTTGTISFGGGTLQYTASNTTDYSSRFSTATNQAYSTDTNGQNVTWASALTSSGGTLTKSGTGTLTLSGANTYTGGTSINGGILSLGSAGALGTTGTISFGGGTLQYTASNTTDYSSRFSTATNQAYSTDTNGQNVTWASALTSSGGTLTKSGTGTLTLGGANTYTGGTSINGGILSLGSAGALGTTGTISFGGGTLGYTAGNTTDYSSRFSTAANQAFLIDTGSQHVTWASALTSSGGTLTKAGIGTLTLSGANTYSGGTAINYGALVLGSAGALGTTGTISFGGGQLVYSASNTTDYSSRFSTAANQAYSVDTDIQNVTWASALTSSGGTFTKTGPGTLTLSGTNTYTGGTTLNYGVLSLGSAGALGTTGTISFNGGALGYTAGNTTDYSSRFSTAANQAYSVDTNGQNVTWATALTSSGGTLTKSGTGTLTLTGTNTYTGGTAINGGFLALGSAGALGTTGTITFGGGSLQHTASNTNDYSSRFSTAANQAYSVDTNGQNVTWASALTSSGGTLTKSGTGTLTLGGANTYTGVTNVNTGTLAFSSAQPSLTGQINVASGASLQFNANDTFGTFTSTTSPTIVVNGGTLTNNGAQFNTLQSITLNDGTMGGTGANTATYPTWSVRGAVTSTGTSSINPTGTNAGFSLGQDGDTFFNVQSGTLTVSTRIIDNQNTSGNTALPGWLYKNGNGTLVLSGANTYTGGTGINGGILSLGSAGALGTTGLILFNGGTLQYTAGNTTDYSSRFYAGSNQNYSVDTNGQNVTWASALTSSGGNLTKWGSGTLTLTGNNTYYGVTTLNGGVLSLGSTGALGSSGLLFFGGTLQYTSSNTTDYSYRIYSNPNQAYSVDTNGQTVSWAAALTSSGGTLTKSGAGTLTLTGTNTYTGGTNINGGTLSLGSAGALGTTGTISFGGGALGYTASNTTDYSSRFNNAANQAYSVDTNGQAVTWASALTSSGGTLTKSGAGTLTLTGTNTYTGGTNINGGILSLGSTGALGTTGTISFGGGRLRYTASNTTDYSSRFSTAANQFFSVDTNGQNVTWATGLTSTGSSYLLIVGGGTLTLPATNTIGGYISVNSGTLNIPGGGSISSTNGIINGSGTVSVGGGTGTASWNMTGTLSVGNGSQGTLNLNTSGIVTAATLTGGDPSTSINFDGGTLQISATAYDNIATNLLAGGGTIGVPTAGTTFTHAGVITGVGAFTKIGPGTLTLTGTNTYTGGTNINGGVLSLGSAGALGTTGTISFGGGALGYTSSNTTDYSSRFSTAANQAYSVDTNQDITWTTPLTSSGGSLTKTGFGTLTLPGTNTFNGSLTANGGTIKVTGSISNTSSTIGDPTGSNGAVSVDGSAGAATWNTSGTLVVGNNGFGQLNIYSGGVVSSATTYLGNAAGSGGTVVVSGSPNAATWNNSGTLVVGNNGFGQLSIYSGGVVSSATSYLGYAAGSNGTVIVDGSAGAASWNISGSLVVGNNGTGTLQIITGGVVTAPALDGGNGTSSINFIGGTLRITGTDAAINTMNLLAGGGTLSLPTAGTTFTHTGTISGAGSLTKTGLGTLVLTGNNTFTGGLNVNQGSLSVASDSPLGDVSGVVTVRALGTLNFTANATTSRSFDLTTGTLRTAGGSTLTLNNALVGGGYLTGNFATAGSALLSGSTTLSSANLSLGGTPTITNFNNSGQLTSNSGSNSTLIGFYNQPAGRMTVGAGGVVNVQDFQSSGVINITGTGQLNNTGSSSIVLGGGSVTNIGVYNPLNGQVTSGGTIDIGAQDIVVQGGFLRNNGTITGAGKLVVDFGGVAKGSGDYDTGGTVLRNGGVLLAGNSPGLQRQSNLTLSGGTTGGDLNNAKGVAGGFAAPVNGNTNNSGWSLFEYGNSANTGGGLSLQRVAGGPVNWRFRTTTNDGIGDTPGAPANFDPALTYSWVIFRPRTNAGVTNPIPTLPSDQLNNVAIITLLDQNSNILANTDLNLNSVLSFDSSLFINPLTGNPILSSVGTFSFSFGPDLANRANTDIFLNYTPIVAVPEPTTWALISLGVAGCSWTGYRRYRNRNALLDADVRVGE